MTKQKEVREGTAKKLAELEGFTWDWIVENKFEDEWFGKADELLSYQDSQGVVIKVCERDIGGGFVGSYTRPETLWEVEPLIESLLDTRQKRGV